MKMLKNLTVVLFAALIFVSNAEAKKVTGVITHSQYGTPLPGVQVLVKNTNISAKSDHLGKYGIDVPTAGTVLVFKHNGFRTKEEKVGNRTVVDVKLVAISPPQPDQISIVPAEHEVVKSPANYSMKARTGGAVYRQPVFDHPPHNTEEYDAIDENTFHDPFDQPLSTFSIDVDGASYSNLRRVINAGQMPQKDMVRIEEMINYFNYDYPNPTGEHPFSITTEISSAPWNEEHKLVHIGLQGKMIDYDEVKPSNLVFLVDVSGSMGAQNKLPLLKSSLRLLVNKLKPTDRVAIVVYAGAAGLVLPSTKAANKEEILAALDNLKAGGSTAGGAGIKLAYQVAKENLMRNGNNRVILATDGDFNVGVSSSAAMVELIEEKRKDGIFLTITGFGMGNYKDGRMEQISNAGNGNYFYIDNIKEAEKVFVKEMRATLFTIAKDVKLQVEFNPSKVQAYRLIGYENRMLEAEDFNDDKKDAGELGAGHTVTALYEVIPVGVKSEFLRPVDKLKYQAATSRIDLEDAGDEILTVKFRYKEPDEEKSKLIVHPLKDYQTALSETSENFQFSAAVAQFGMLLRNSEFKQNASYESVMQLAHNGKGQDVNGYRAEFIRMVESCSLLAQ